MLSDFVAAFKAVRHKNDLEAQNAQIEQEIRCKTSGLESMEIEAKEKQAKIDKLNQEIKKVQFTLDSTEGKIIAEELCCYCEPSNNIPSYELKDSLEAINDKITQLAMNDEIVNHAQSYTVNNSAKKGQEFQKFYGENLVLGFNTYFDKKAKCIKQDNYQRTVELIKSNYAKMNKRASIIGASLNPRYLNLKLQSLKTLLDIKITVAEEKAKLAEEKRQLREQEKLLEEAEKTKAKLAKERIMYEQNLASAMNEAKRKEFEDKLAEIDKRIADVDYRVNNAKAGYLYVTSTPAMPNYLKLGITRRLNPLVRIAELSSASTPYPFVCHALVFSDNVFELENNIHHYFDNERVNKENLHKEFFRITPEQAIKALKDEFNCEVHLLGEEESEEE